MKTTPKPVGTRIDKLHVVIPLNLAIGLLALALAVGVAGGWTVRRFQTEDIYIRSAAETFFAERNYFNKQAAAITAEAETKIKEKKHGNSSKTDR